MSVDEILHIESHILLHFIVGLIAIISFIPLSQEIQLNITNTVYYLLIILITVLLVRCIICLYEVVMKK